MYSDILVRLQADMALDRQTRRS